MNTVSMDARTAFSETEIISPDRLNWHEYELLLGCFGCGNARIVSLQGSRLVRDETHDAAQLLFEEAVNQGIPVELSNSRTRELQSNVQGDNATVCGEVCPGSQINQIISDTRDLIQ